MKLLLTGAFNWKSSYIEKLKSNGFEIMYTEREDSNLLPDHYLADAVICNWLFVNHNIEKFPSLKYIQLLSAGIDRVPIEYIKNHYITLNNARGVYSIPMAEYAVNSVLQIYKGSLEFYNNQKKHLWMKNRNLRELSESRVCIVGTGSVGTATGKLFSAFTNEVYGIDLYPREDIYFRKIYSMDRLDEQLSISDVIILTLPITDDTRNLFNSKRFSIFKNGSVFVNMSRGSLVDENALVNALNNNLYGAALDVFENEPLNEQSQLWDIKNLIITPHNSFISDRNESRMWNLICKNLEEFKMTK